MQSHTKQGYGQVTRTNMAKWMAKLGEETPDVHIVLPASINENCNSDSDYKGAGWPQ